jgi:hypothetical protein
MIEKIIISPQIVVYKNILKNNKSILDMLQSKDNDLVKWDTWYENGWRSSIDFKSLEKKDSENFSEIKAICEAFDYIHEDYIKEYSGSNGIWPNFIKDWNNVNISNSDYKIDFFRYNYLKFKDMNWDSDLLMNYHVDEFSIDGVVKEENKIITINFYLNDDYEGGEICAYNKDLDISYRYKPVAGDAVVMPSSAPFFHAVKPFYLTDRYFLRLFITYKDSISNESNNNSDYFSKNHYVSDLNEKEFIDNDYQFLNVLVKEVEVGKNI